MTCVENSSITGSSSLAANPDLKGYLNCDACGSGIAAAVEEAERKVK